MGSLSVVDVIKTISDDKSLVLVNTIALASGNVNTLKTTLKLTRRQYYSRMSGLVNAGLVTRKNGNYFVTSFGKIVYDAQLMIAKAVVGVTKDLVSQIR
jgi:predicted transcriptional regulator